MNVESNTTPFPPEKRERLVMIIHPKRASLIFFYAFSVVMVIIGVSFMSATAYGMISTNSLYWNIGAATIVIGIIIFAITEIRRQFQLYIITTWNVRVRTGFVRKKTKRVFYDEITECRISINPEEKNVDLGNVEICTKKNEHEPVLIFEEVDNPDGIREIITRFVQTIPDPLPWGHLKR